MQIRPRSMYFDTPYGVTFARYYLPHEPVRPLGVVLCPPIGSELMCSYHPMQALAQAIAHSGVAALCIDYHGTGNAEGDDQSPDRVAAWLATIETSIDHLRALGSDRVGLVGLRLGATLAAVVASRRKDLTCAVLWAPLKTGKAYTREMKMLAQSESNPVGSKQDAAVDGGIEAGGFFLTERTVAQLAEIDLSQLPELTLRTVLIARDDMPGSRKLATGLGATQVEWPGYANMMLAPHYAVSAPETFSRITAWLAESAVGEARGSAPNRFDKEPAAELSGEVRERAIRFGPNDALFGVLAEPMTASRRATAVVLPNMGANYHVGPNRMYVTMARQWAASGYSVLRFDLGGMGNSEPWAGQPLNTPYSELGVADLELAVAELKKRTGASDVISIGLCSGAYVSFHAALRGLSLTAQVLVNPQAFYWKAGMSLDAAPSAVAGQTQAYGESMRSWSSWKKLLTGRAKYRALMRTMALRTGGVGSAWLKRGANRLGLRSRTGNLAHDLRRIADHNIHTLIIYSENDAGMVYLKEHAAHAAQRLVREGHLQIQSIANADHTFTLQSGQRQLIDAISVYLKDKP